MSVELSKEIWNELKRYVNVVDRDETAENNTVEDSVEE